MIKKHVFYIEHQELIQLIKDWLKRTKNFEVSRVYNEFDTLFSPFVYDYYNDDGWFERIGDSERLEILKEAFDNCEDYSLRYVEKDPWWKFQKHWEVTCYECA